MIWGQKEAARSTGAVSQATQGQWINKISWIKVWGIEVGRIRFTLEATYEVLPSPHTLSKLIGEDSTYSLCSGIASFWDIYNSVKEACLKGPL